MQEQQYDERWSDRATRYPDSTPLPAGVTVHITVDPAYAKTYAGQVAAVTAASILGRMAKSVAIKVPPEPVSHLLPWKGETLNEVVSQTLADTHQYGQYVSREAEHRRPPRVHWTRRRRHRSPRNRLGRLLWDRQFPFGQPRRPKPVWRSIRRDYGSCTHTDRARSRRIRAHNSGHVHVEDWHSEPAQTDKTH